MDDLAMLVRFQVAAATGHLPADLALWAQRRLWQSVPATQRRLQRDVLLRLAADRVGGSLWAKACELNEIIEYFRQYPGMASVGVMVTDSAAEVVQQAWRIHQDLPRFRQLLSILS